MPKAATCTPVDFPSDPHFWGRDTGLLCRSLQSEGVDCACIMPGQVPGIDAGGALRASMQSLESPDWWRIQGLDFVVLYAWGDPRYLVIARAIRAAGIMLIQNLDSAGIETPYADVSRWWTCLRDMIRGPQPVSAKLRLLARMARDLFPRIYETKRLAMMEESDVLAVVSPAAGESIRSYVSALRSGHLASRIQVIPHAVPDFMHYDGRMKSKSMIAVGRWNKEDWHQKNPQLTLEVARAFCLTHPDWTFEIIGRGADRLSGMFPDGVEPPNLTFTPQLERNALRECYLNAFAILCTSRFESYHIASAEAACCGCRVIVPHHPLLASTAWFTDNGSGTIATSHRPVDLLAALDREVSHFEMDALTRAQRAERWESMLTGPAVAKTILDLVETRLTPVL